MRTLFFADGVATKAGEYTDYYYYDDYTYTTGVVSGEQFALGCVIALGIVIVAEIYLWLKHRPRHV